MKDYIHLSIQFIEELKKTKNNDGSTIWASNGCSNKFLFKQYLSFATKHGLGVSRTAYDKGLLSVLEALGFITRQGEEILFGKTVFEEYKTEQTQKPKGEKK